MIVTIKFLLGALMPNDVDVTPRGGDEVLSGLDVHGLDQKHSGYLIHYFKSQAGILICIVSTLVQYNLLYF